MLLVSDTFTCLWKLAWEVNCGRNFETTVILMNREAASMQLASLKLLIIYIFEESFIEI